MVLTQKIFCLFSLGFVCFWLVSTANLEFFCIHTINQYLKKQKNSSFFWLCFFLLWFDMVSKAKKKVFFVFCIYAINQYLQKTKKKLKVFFLLLLWFDMVSKAKSKKKLEFLFFAYMLSTISQKKLRSFLFVCFCCYGLICYAVFDSKSTRHIA